jgi:hypothetical protein
MVASTISTERETTQVRRRKRANQCHWRALLLDRLHLVFADIVPARRQGRVVGRPIVGAEQAHAPRLQASQQALERALIAIAALPVDQPPRTALEGLPDPEFAGLFWMKCQTSSSSTTIARPVGSGLGQ